MQAELDQALTGRFCAEQKNGLGDHRVNEKKLAAKDVKISKKEVKIVELER